MSEYHVTTEMEGIAHRMTDGVPAYLNQISGTSNMTFSEARMLQKYIKHLCEQCQVKIIKAHDQRRESSQ